MDGARLRDCNCLVTGAAGFIGSHLTRRLVENGARVSVIVRPGTSLGKIADIAHRVTVHRVDLEDSAQTAKCAREARPEVVFHLAAKTRGVLSPSVEVAASSFEKTLKPLVGLLAALSDVPIPPNVLVRTGTIAEYGQSPLPFREDLREVPVTPYGVAKLAGTHMLTALQDTLPFATVTARLALTYGEGQDRSFFVPALVDSCLKGRTIAVRRPEDRRDLIHVADVVDALLLMAGQSLQGSCVVNISTGRAPTMREVAEAAVAATGCDPSLIEMDSDVAMHASRELRADPGLARALFGWKPRIPLEQGLEMMVRSQSLPGTGERLHHG